MLVGKVKRVSEAQKRGKLLIDQVTWLSACFQRCYFINFTYIFWKKKKKSFDLGFKIKLLSLFKPSRVYYMWGIALCASFHPQRSYETGAISVKETTSAVM